MAINPPRTIDGVREALPEDRRDQFMAEVGRTPHTMLPVLVDNWRAMAIALSLPTLVEAMTEPVDLDHAQQACGVSR
ncbi:hypothetical protein ABZ746_18545 [Streptomyces sp. NPDC020096]